MNVKRMWSKIVCLFSLVVMVLSIADLGSTLAEEANNEKNMIVNDGATLFEGHLYRALDISMSWEDAKTFCENVGGHLAAITSLEEQALIESLLPEGEKNCYWIGGT